MRQIKKCRKLQFKKDIPLLQINQQDNLHNNLIILNENQIEDRFLLI